MVTLCLPKSPRRRPLRASPAPSQTASFCPAHSSCPQRPMPTVLRTRQGKPLPLPPDPKVETPRREEGPMSAQASSVLIGSFSLMFFSVRFFFPVSLSPVRGNSLRPSSSLYKFRRSPSQAPTLFRLSHFLVTCLTSLSYLLCFSVGNPICFC